MRRRLRDLREQLRRGYATHSPELIEITEILDTMLASVQEEHKRRQLRREWEDRTHSQLDRRLSRVENSIFFRLLRQIGAWAQESKRAWGQHLLRSPFHSWYRSLVLPVSPDPQYGDWVDETQETVPAPVWNQCGRASYRPLISIVMPVHQPKAEWLQAAIDSVLAQTYPHWQLCICNDASTTPWLAEYLEQLAKVDSRVVIATHPTRRGISAALNTAGRMSRGDYVAFLDHDDLLSSDALQAVAERLQNVRADVIYSDEDHLDERGRRERPNFKPDWSPDLLASCMYWGHLMVVSRERLEEVDWFRPEFDGAQDYDLALRLTDRPIRVEHIDQVLYHWRRHEGSTAADPSAKPYAQEAGRRALAAAVERRGWHATVEDGPSPHTYRLRHQTPNQTRVSLVICSRNARLLERCLRSLKANTAYSQYEVVVVHHQVDGVKDVEMKRLLESQDCIPVPYVGPFHFAKMNNAAVHATSGEILVFLNDDVMPLDPHWLCALVAQAQRQEVGVVGAKLLYPSGALQHAGIVTGMADGSGHVGRGLFRSDLWPWLDLTRNVTAVTGACLCLRREVFDAMGGFDLSFPINYNDIDLCLRAREAGYEVIYEPMAVLRHDECQTRLPGVRYEERQLFQQRWADRLRQPDPFYSSHLSSEEEQLRIRAVERLVAGTIG